MNDVSTQETSEVKKQGTIVSVDSKPAEGRSKEVEIPRLVTFGALEVSEDLTTDLLTLHEKKLYRGGFEMLKDVVNGGLITILPEWF